MTSIDGAPGKGCNTQGALPGGASGSAGIATIGVRVARIWRTGSTCIPAGLTGSFLTCLASVGVNLLVDNGGAAFPAALYLHKLATGYAAAAAVVVVVFPLLPLIGRRRGSRVLVDTPRI